MTRFLLTACCALLGVGVALVVEAQRAGDPRRGIRVAGGKGGPGGDACITPATCQVNAPVFNFGRSEMNSNTPPINSNTTISVTCSKAVNVNSVELRFELFGQIVNAPPRVMRDIGDTGVTLAYDVYIDPARVKLWGSGEGNNGTGTFPLEGYCLLDDRNRSCTLVFPLYGTVLGGQSPIPPGKFQGAIVSTLNYRFGNCI